mmetsp:Transcript_88295/g.285816  ORF Transcript_88295/g.285816 Transcript_88295/m.285816 type:complete len:267 (-) Transcript_88295:270-1070(-)
MRQPHQSEREARMHTRPSIAKGHPLMIASRSLKALPRRQSAAMTATPRNRPAARQRPRATGGRLQSQRRRQLRRSGPRRRSRRRLWRRRSQRRPRRRSQWRSRQRRRSWRSRRSRQPGRSRQSPRRPRRRPRPRRPCPRPPAPAACTRAPTPTGSPRLPPATRRTPRRAPTGSRPATPAPAEGSTARRCRCMASASTGSSAWAAGRCPRPWRARSLPLAGTPQFTSASAPVPAERAAVSSRCTAIPRGPPASAWGSLPARAGRRGA